MPKSPIVIIIIFYFLFDARIYNFFENCKYLDTILHAVIVHVMIIKIIISKPSYACISANCCGRVRIFSLNIGTGNSSNRTGNGLISLLNILSNTTARNIMQIDAQQHNKDSTIIVQSYDSLDGSMLI